MFLLVQQGLAGHTRWMLDFLLPWLCWSFCLLRCFILDIQLLQVISDFRHISAARPALNGEPVTCDFFLERQKNFPNSRLCSAAFPVGLYCPMLYRLQDEGVNPYPVVRQSKMHLILWSFTLYINDNCIGR